MKKIIIIILILFTNRVIYSSQFDELDKPPEGAHKGQMFLGALASFGKPYGSIINAEHDFLDGSSYTFSDSGITKQLLVDHLAFALGIGFEYMPLEFMGAKVKFKRSYIIQRTIFGAQYENWNDTIYSDFSFFLGPAFHLTNRKRWDVTLTPVLGYAIARYNATPIAAVLIENYSGSRKRSADGMALGAELNFSGYFTGGLFITIGFDWTMNMIKLDKPYNLSQPNGNAFFAGKTSSSIHSLAFILSAGYAFSN